MVVRPSITVSFFHPVNPNRLGKLLMNSRTVNADVVGVVVKSSSTTVLIFMLHMKTSVRNVPVEVVAQTLPPGATIALPEVGVLYVRFTTKRDI